MGEESFALIEKNKGAGQIVLVGLASGGIPLSQVIRRKIQVIEGVDGPGRGRRRRRSTRVRDFPRGTRSSSPPPAGMPCRVPAGRSGAKWSPCRKGVLPAVEWVRGQGGTSPGWPKPSI